MEEEEAQRDFSRRALQVSQQVFDPLQRAVAGNCSLCRHTDALIARTFVNAPRRHVERFVVAEMWPISQLCCGVITKQMTA